MKTIAAIIAGIVVTALIFLVSLAPSGRRNIGAIENIHGIPYVDGLITEELAHADIYLKEPVLGKQLTLNIDFDPGNTTSLAVGVREDPFWLSYNSRVSLTESPATVTIPLTDKLQETDRSIDLMFVATAEEQPGWKLNDLEASVAYAKPPLSELKDYVRSIVKKERAL